VIDAVSNGRNAAIHHCQHHDARRPSKPFEAWKLPIKFKIEWHYTINNRMTDGGRSGYEYFEEENNTLYTIAQFFPRMAVYGDNVGWQHKQFLGQGEFTLPFGNYKVAITVPEDHIVAATGVLTNESSILNATQRKRLAQARQTFDNPDYYSYRRRGSYQQKVQKLNPKQPAPKLGFLKQIMCVTLPSLPLVNSYGTPWRSR
jgi:hypothetical protein